MRNIWTIFKREFGYYFVSPVAYLVMFMYLITLGLIFSYQLGIAAQYGSAPDVGGWVLGPFVTLALFLTELLTMRLVSEEHRTGTMELILTAPVREWELVLGKWLAALAYYGVILVVTVLYALVANAYTQPGIDVATLAVSYLGMILFVAALLAIGLFTSTLFSNQIAAAFAALAIYLGLWLISLPFQDRADAVGDVFKYLNISSHYDTFSTGVIALTDVVYFVSLIIFFLFAAAQTIESRRWR